MDGRRGSRLFSSIRKSEEIGLNVDHGRISRVSAPVEQEMWRTMVENLQKAPHTGNYGKIPRGYAPNI
jgi:hypothetical protein